MTMLARDAIGLAIAACRPVQRHHAGFSLAYMLAPTAIIEIVKGHEAGLALNIGLTKGPITAIESHETVLPRTNVGKRLGTERDGRKPQEKHRKSQERLHVRESFDRGDSSRKRACRPLASMGSGSPAGVLQQDLAGGRRLEVPHDW